MKTHVPLAPYTSFGVGGKAEYFAQIGATDELLGVLRDNVKHPIWLLGYGSNTLVSDKGLPGLTICLHGGDIIFEDNVVIADAGVWWDDIVRESITRGLWGIELMSEIPGSFGAALYINITAYGQSLGNRVLWIEVWDPQTQTVQRLSKNELQWGYKQSVFQNEATKHKVIILRAALKLSDQQSDELIYQKARDVAEELQLDENNLEDRRAIIVEARKRAGSLWHPDDVHATKTVGSFFRNPVVSEEVAEQIISFDESHKTVTQIKAMNTVHGGDARRVSAAHVMLAAGFKRGQKWDNVRLNEKNVLKIEALPGATAQEIYTVSRHIQKTCDEKLGVRLEPEAQLLGEFHEESLAG